MKVPYTQNILDSLFKSKKDLIFTQESDAKAFSITANKDDAIELKENEGIKLDNYKTSITPKKQKAVVFFTEERDFDARLKTIKNISDDVNKNSGELIIELNKLLTSNSLNSHVDLSALGKEIESRIQKIVKPVTDLNQKASENILLCKEVIEKGLAKYYLDVYNNQSKDDDNVVIRFGIDSDGFKEGNIDLIQEHCAQKSDNTQDNKSSKKTGKSSNDKVVLLNAVEVILIANAIEYLINNNTTKTVLVDIFDKNENGTIKTKKEDQIKPETHTIILYKNDKSNISVIDPSNSSYSKHMELNLNKEFINIISEYRIDSISVHPVEVRIYTPNGKTGTNADQYRDCIDVAVKIAFGFNKSGEEFDITKISSNKIISEITNQDKLNADLSMFLSDDSALRIRQASDEKIRKGVNNKIISVKKHLDSISSYPTKNENAENKIKELKIKVIEKYVTAVTENFNCAHYEKFDTNFDKAYDDITREFSSIILGEDTK